MPCRLLPGLYSDLPSPFSFLLRVVSAQQLIGGRRLQLERPRVLVLSGPTAIGKTNLSLELAQRLNGEIISADSMQVYKGMDVGTDKVSAAERKRIPHHLIDLVSPHEAFSAFQFWEHAHNATHVRVPSAAAAAAASSLHHHAARLTHLLCLLRCVVCVCHVCVVCVVCHCILDHRHPHRTFSREAKCRSWWAGVGST
jgi:hypothetical protein